MAPESAWIAVGLGGQALFSMRFIVQWLESERARRSIVPVAFWYLSLGGGALLTLYAIWRRDPVFVVGQATGLFVYARNLWLLRAPRDAGRAPPVRDAGRATPG